ncbi:MAG: YdcF family protein [Candidatus Sulfotelmatobacter sp.]
MIANDPAANRVDAAVVLQGSVAAEKVRIAGAIDLLQRNLAGRVLLSVPKESYWGQSIPPVARAYLERTYGNDLAERFDFCETGGDVNSTTQEAQALLPCISAHGYQSIEIVTSNYHTRRAGMIWGKMTRNGPRVNLWILGVIDPEFQQPWWRHRQSAKTFFMETTKLIWTVLGG